MCCRYYTGEETSAFIRSVAGRMNVAAFPIGDIRPSDHTAVITGSVSELCAEDMRWGFLSRNAKGLIINARSESAFDKPLFAESMLQRRCIIAAEHFYEWDRNKDIVTFTLPDRPVLCMAGIWNRFEYGNRFTVLTTAANDSMLPVHDRMPLILSEGKLRDWIFGTDAAREIIKMEQPELQRQQEYEQLSLF